MHVIQMGSTRGRTLKSNQPDQNKQVHIPLIAPLISHFVPFSRSPRSSSRLNRYGEDTRSRSKSFSDSGGGGAVVDLFSSPYGTLTGSPEVSSLARRRVQIHAAAGVSLCIDSSCFCFASTTPLPAEVLDTNHRWGVMCSRFYSACTTGAPTGNLSLYRRCIAEFLRLLEGTFFR